MIEFSTILTLYYGDLPGRRTAKLLRVSEATVSRWKLDKQPVPPYAYRRLLENVPNRLKQIEKTAIRLRANIDAWEEKRSGKCRSAETLLRAQVQIVKGETRRSLREEPLLNQKSEDGTLRKRASASQPQAVSNSLADPTSARKAEDTSSQAGRLLQTEKLAYTQELQAQQDPLISQNLEKRTVRKSPVPRTLAKQTGPSRQTG